MKKLTAKREASQSSKRQMSLNKEKLKGWLKNPYNLIFLIILIATIATRLYYFDMTKNQPLWWDESEYMSAAKNFAGKVDYQLISQRNALLPATASIFYILGIENEVILRFFLLLIPSILVILLFYICINEMYSDKRIALISMALASFLWEHMFFSNRFQTDNFGLIFGILSAYLTFKMYLKKEDIWIFKHKYAIIYIMICAVIAFLFRTGDIVFIPLAILYLLIIEKTNFFRKKEVIYGGIGIGILLLIQITYNYISRGDFIAGYLTYFKYDDPINLAALNIFKGFYESLNLNIPPILYYAFLVGIVFILFEVFIKRKGLLKLSRDKEELNTKGDIYSIINIIVMLFMFMVISRSPTYEFRWFFPLLIGMFSITARGITIISDYAQLFISENKKWISTLVILLLLLPGLYYELQHSDMIIKLKVDSYSQVRDAALWMKENSNKNDIIFSISEPQTTFYSERKTMEYRYEDYWRKDPSNYTDRNEESILKLIKEKKPKFLTVSVFERHPESIINLTRSRQDILIPVNGFFLDPGKTQVALVIYQINYANLYNT